MKTAERAVGAPNTQWSSIEEIAPPVDAAGRYTLASVQPYGPEKPIAPQACASANPAAPPLTSCSHTKQFPQLEPTFVEVDAEGMSRDTANENCPLVLPSGRQKVSEFPTAKTMAFRVHSHVPRETMLVPKGSGR
jgi:hypothetical protein